jgi:xanthine dehydrogenase molybdopterin-binding subunit B
VGNAEDAIAKAPNVIEGEFFTDAQYHFYLEQHVSIAAKNEEDLTSKSFFTDIID